MNIIKRIAVIGALCFLLRGLVTLGADAAFDSLVQAAMNNESLVATTVLSQSALLQATASEQESPTDLHMDSNDLQDSSETGEDLAHQPPTVETPEAEETTPVLPPAEPVTLTGNDSQASADGIYLKNETAYDVDIQALLDESLNISLDGDGPKVLIIHAHGTESYTPDGEDMYEESDPYRTEDERFNMLRVGDEMQAVFEEAGISVIHDRNLYDYPSMVNSYVRSMDATQAYLEQYPSIELVIDVHRDAISGTDGGQMKTVAALDGVSSSQVMLVMGTNSSGLWHDNWRENLKLAVHIQSEMNERYPSLARPINLREHRFNQHLSNGAMLVEIGSAGNTLQEAITAGRLFAECAAAVFNETA